MKLLLLIASATLFWMTSFSQVTLFQDDFESGGGNWTLNTGSGTNNWYVSADYTGWAPLIVNTPDQPGTITNAPQSTYMHITNTTMCGGLGVCNANFDTGGATNQNTELTTPVDASLYTDVTISFWYLSGGMSGTSYGSIEYSTDGGSIWTDAGVTYSGVTSWTMETLTLPAWDNVASFQVRFKWQNGGSGLDPAFSVDQFEIYGTPGGSVDIITGAVNPSSWCNGSDYNLNVAFTSTGTFGGSNTYTAELSDETGSFASPLAIGALTTSSSGTLSIPSIVPGSTTAGSLYRIRVVSNDPVYIGSDNGGDILISDCAGLGEGEFNSLHVYPNPASESITIDFDNDFEEVELHDLNGRLIQSFGNDSKLNVSKIDAGTYIISILSEGKRIQERIMVL